MPIKVLHTSDWHLGKRLFKYERLEEQVQFLDWLYQHITKNQIDILIVAGDIFDVPSPPNNALKVFYDFIARLGELGSVQTVLITGNHDSATLFDAPKLLFETHNCHIYNRLDADLSKLEYYFEKDNQKIGIKLLPYFRNYELQNHLVDSKDDEDQKVKKFFQNFLNKWKQEPDIKILVGHHVFGNYELSGSEHAIYLSGVDHIPLNWVTPHFDYVALGHIHKKQALSKDPGVIYTGSPIPMRFSESNNKYISEIKIESNNLSYDFVKIPIFKKLIQLKTKQKTYKEDIEDLLLSSSNNSETTLLEVMVQLEGPQTGIVTDIREMLKYTSIEMISFIPSFNTQEEKSTSYQDVRSLNIMDLFDRYYYDKFGEETVPREMKECFTSLLNEVKNEDT